MPRFRFKLDKVLEYRGQLEEQAKAALAQARVRHAEQQERLDRIVAEQERAAAELAATRNPSAADLWLWRSYQDRLRLDRERAQGALAKLAQEVEQAREKLVDAARDRKLLEKLKHKQARRHAQEESAREQKDYDDSATVRFARQEAVG